MNRIESLFDSVRYTLGDRDGSRWPDSRLIQLLDEGQKDLVREAKLLRNSALIYPKDIQDPTIYALPDDFMVLTRAVYDSEKLPIRSQEVMDELAPDWEAAESSGGIEALVHDRLNQGLVRVYPKPVAGQIESYTFENTGYLEEVHYTLSSDYGFFAKADTLDSVVTDYGILVDMDETIYTYGEGCPGVATIIPFSIKAYDGTDTYVGEVTDVLDFVMEVIPTSPTMGVVVSITGYGSNSDYGLVAELVDTENTDSVYNSVYGVLTGLSYQEDLPAVKIYYLQKPQKITSVNDQLEVADIWDQALKHYVAGRALLDDIDAQNRQVGSAELELYMRELALAKKQSSEDFTRRNYIETNYRKGV